MKVKVKKAFFWFLMFLLEVGMGIAIFFLFAPSGSMGGPTGLIMSASDAALTKGAITFVLNDVNSGKLTDVDSVIIALKAELPSSVQMAVIEALGSPDYQDVPDRLIKITEKIVVRE